MYSNVDPVTPYRLLSPIVVGKWSPSHEYVQVIDRGRERIRAGKPASCQVGNRPEKSASRQVSAVWPYNARTVDLVCGLWPPSS
jgi:hypothetical protein